LHEFFELQFRMLLVAHKNQALAPDLLQYGRIVRAAIIFDAEAEKHAKAFESEHSFHAKGLVTETGGNVRCRTLSTAARPSGVANAALGRSTSQNFVGDENRSELKDIATNE
jgi:hypothetical protein